MSHSPEKSDYKSDDSEPGKKFDVATKEELLQLAKKQEKALTRYKTKFSEVLCSIFFSIHNTVFCLITWNNDCKYKLCDGKDLNYR